MIVPVEILKERGGHFLRVIRGEFIFSEDEQPLHYFQVIEGSVKMSSYSTNGQEFIQGIFNPGESFGEPAIFGGFAFPNNAIALEDSLICKLPKDLFFEILDERTDIQRKFFSLLSNRLRYKAILLKEISSYYPEHIIITLLNYIRDNSSDYEAGAFRVPYTRQQLADMSGLRVETVIRTVKKLESDEKLYIKNHKIYLPSPE